MRLRYPSVLAAIVVCVCAVAASAQVSEMEVKKRQEMGLTAGTVITKDNAHLIDGLMPPELLEYYKKGEWSNRVEDWPLGKYQWDEEFLRANDENAQHIDLDENGGIVDRRSGQYPEYLYGYPFPKIDPNDPKAGSKIVWNQMYLIFAHLTNANYYVDIVWMNRSGIERVSRQQVYFKYWDGQKKKYLNPENPQRLLQQYIAAAESPQDLYGTTALQWRFKTGKRDLMWTYIPALRRIRSVSPANRSDGFLGSDISQDDGPFFDGLPSDFEWKLAGEGEVMRLTDPYSLKGEVGREALPDGTYREQIRSDISPFGARDPNWKGVPWAPVPTVLTKRPVWIVEGVPKDKYGRNLYIDTFNSAYGAGWKRESGILTHRGTGTFCHSFVPQRPFAGYPSQEIRPAAAGERHRITVGGPGVTPVMQVELSGLNQGDRGRDGEFDAIFDQLMADDKACARER